MEFRVLGALEMLQENRPVPVGGQRQQALLAMLLLRANKIVDVGQLVASIWDKPPVAPGSNIRTYVACLRRKFREAGDTDCRLTTRSGGYLLAVGQGELDLAVFSDLLGEGENAAADHDFAVAADRFGRALRLWRGRPLTGLSAGPVLRANITRLADLRLTVAEKFAHAQLELGQPAAAIGDLRALLAEHPHREELWAQLILALHRTGRQAEALETYARARNRLVDDLGIEPGSRLRALQQEVLADGPAPAPAGGEPAECAGVNACHQLPMDIPEFTGRHSELRTLYSLAELNEPPATAVVITAIEGMAGVGKTRLAVHAAHRLAVRFADFQLWTDLRGFDAEHPPAEPGAVLRTFLRLLGVPAPQIPHGLEERAALYRDRLAGKRALILLDNAASEDQVRPLLPGAAGCHVLVTSRRHLVKLDGVHTLTLDVLSSGEAADLMATITPDARILAEPKSAATVAELCGRLPIALSLVARRLRSRPMWTVRELADRLTRHGQEADLRAVFDLSHRALGPAQRRLFRLLGLHVGADFTAESAAALHHTTPERAEVLLESLLDEHLVQQVTAGRYRLHDLLRAYARDRAQAEEPPARRRVAVHRLLTWYLHTAESARTELDPHRSRMFDLVPLPAGCVVRKFGGYDEALAWFEAERSTLREVVAAAAHGAPEVAWQLPWVLLSFYYRRSYWDDWVATYEIGLAAARSLGERGGEAIMWRGLGVANSDLRRFEVALDCHRRAQALLERVGDRHGQAWNLNNAGVIHVDLGELTEAAGHFERALELFLGTDDRQGQGFCLNNLGDTYRLLGEPARAIGYLERALLVQHGIGDQAGLRFTLSTLGDLHRDTGRLGDALRHYREALATSRMLADQRITARVLASIAETLTADGEAAQARTYWHQALTIFDELGDAQAESVRAKLAGTS